MNPKVIEAANVIPGDMPSYRARRVLRAQAGCVSDTMVDAALEELKYGTGPSLNKDPVAAMRAAIAAALRKEAEEGDV